MSSVRRKRWLTAVLGLFLAIQLVPYGRVHTNPPVIVEPGWDAAGTRALAKAACFDCHSNETRWPAYSHVAPSSWLIQSDVEGGRNRLNFSEFQRHQRHAGDAAEVVRKREMPPYYYGWMHPAARLGAADRERLAQSLEKMLGPPEPHGSR
jgi:hypothetical protein